MISELIRHVSLSRIFHNESQPQPSKCRLYSKLNESMEFFFFLCLMNGFTAIKLKFLAT
jgi:hypothetical protein